MRLFPERTISRNKFASWTFFRELFPTDSEFVHYYFRLLLLCVTIGNLLPESAAPLGLDQFGVSAIQSRWPQVQHSGEESIVRKIVVSF